MHELSIAQSLIDLVEDELAARQAAAMRGTDPPPCPRVGRVTVRVGALSGVVPEALASAFTVASSQSAIRGAALVIDHRPAVVWCPRCEAERALPIPAQRMRCPTCGTSTPDLRSGRELELTSIEVCEDGHDDDDDFSAPGVAGSCAAADPGGADADHEEERRDGPVAP